ncbi:hypothetical protein LCGC14_2615970 [marine sediment metagenome]|uniref:Uncharacterized protein n=1 Tax=marine sediment metagenome TaxID=412755 RepID=A0A0F9AS29_9ZZZZ
MKTYTLSIRETGKPVRKDEFLSEEEISSGHGFIAKIRLGDLTTPEEATFLRKVFVLLTEAMEPGVDES